MARHIYFGDDGDIPLTGIFDDVPYFFLCIESLLFFSFAYRTASPGEVRILLDFDAPSQSFCQMPVEVVHFEQ